METWIKLYRKFADWEWFNISEMVHLFIYLLISANNEDGEWRGIKVKRGQLITGRKSLNESTGISEQTLRTCLRRLENTKEITIQSTNQYSIITVCKYEEYQPKKMNSNQPVNQPLTSDQPATNHKQEVKEIKKNIYSDFYDSQIELSGNNENYIKVVKALYGENNLKVPLNVLLKMPTQLSFSQFEKIWFLKEKYKFSIIQILEKMQDWGNPKKRTTIYNTFLTFAKNEKPELKC